MTSVKKPRITGVGTTSELSLRVSVATLTRVAFPRPGDGEPLLAFEHKATLRTVGDVPRIVVMAQPFGGAIRILKFTHLQTLIEGFQFDSDRSLSEQDFRIFIRPSDWQPLRDFCLQEFRKGEESDLESDPTRELVEEFDDSLGVELRPHQYTVKPLRIVLENVPTGTLNVHAAGLPTVRIYRVFEAQIVDPALCKAMMTNSENHSGTILRRLAMDDARKGGQGRANAVFVASEPRVREAYLTLSPDKRREPLSFEITILNGNVPAVLDGIVVPEFQTVRD